MCNGLYNGCVAESVDAKMSHKHGQAVTLFINDSGERQRRKPKGGLMFIGLQNVSHNVHHVMPS